MTVIPPRLPPLPWQIRVVSAAVNFVFSAAMHQDGTVNRRLLSFLDFRAPPNPTPVDGVSTSDHTVDPTRNLKIRLFSPSRDSDAAVDDTTSLPVVVYFHGGGFFSSSAFSLAYDAFCRRISRQTPAYVISVDYRLSPEHRHPAAYDDGLDVLRWLDSSTDLIADPSSLFLAGDSAGGNIAHHVARSAMTSSFERLTSAVGLVAIQPFFGGEEETDSERRLEGVPFGSRERLKWMWRSYLPIRSGLDHEAANVFGPGSDSGTKDWSGFPATMVVIGGADTLQDRQRWYSEGLKGAGVEVSVVEYPNAIHAFQFFSVLPESEKVFEDVAEFVRRRRLAR